MSPTSGEMRLATASVDLDAPVELADLLDSRSRRMLTASSRELGLGLHIVDATGKALVGHALPPSVTVPGQELTVVEEMVTGTSRRWLVQQLRHEGDTIGALAIGPFTVEREAVARRVGNHLANLIDSLIGAGLEKVLASRMHSATMEHAYAELQQKNARLASAVDRLQELDKVKSNFLATVSHELRTPLTSVIGYSEMLLEGLAGPLNDEQRDYVRTVMEKGEQLLNIITGILDISRIEAGALTLEHVDFSIEEVIDIAISTVLPTARRRCLTLSKALAPGLPEVRADRDKVRQVLINLVSNAVKFTPEGGKVDVVVTVSSLRRMLQPGQSQPSTLALLDILPGAPASDDRRAVQIAVVDSGIGIPADSLGRIFEPFFQVDSSSTREYGGTGLGLAIVKSFVHAHGGSVWAESTPGKGSTFFITLPLATGNNG